MFEIKLSDVPGIKDPTVLQAETKKELKQKISAHMRAKDKIADDQKLGRAREAVHEHVDAHIREV